MIDPDLLAYLRDVSLRETPVMKANRQATESGANAHLQVDPEQGQLMALLVRLMGARRGIEIGVFAGYSSLWLAGALPPDGRLLACDNDAEIIERARVAWHEAGLTDRVVLCLDEARTTLHSEIAGGAAGSYDFVFIDADKAGYIAYYEQAMTLLRSGGLVMADNTLWHGCVIDDSDDSVDTRAIQAFNRYLHTDTRVETSLVPIGDGLTLARKR